MGADARADLPKLDISKLLGFRTLLSSDALNERDSKELFNKRGPEVPTVDDGAASALFNKVGPGEVPGSPEDVQ